LISKLVISVDNNTYYQASIRLYKQCTGLLCENPTVISHLRRKKELVSHYLAERKKKKDLGDFIVS
jgi:hypothetical protein